MSELLKINVNEHTEKKGGLTYLSWAWAWAEVLKVDPAATWCVHQYGPQGNEQPCMWIGETAMVHTSVTILGIRRECLLPVMDNRNNAVKLPDARKVSDAIMRCMTKAIAMHGLGLYIYAGEDLPQGDGVDREAAREEWLTKTRTAIFAAANVGELKHVITEATKAAMDENDSAAVDQITAWADEKRAQAKPRVAA